MNVSTTSRVLVVGGGPVGLTLAIDLARRGILVTVVESRRYGGPSPVKCNHLAARTMEQFRRLGIVTRLRDAGLPADHPNDAVFRTRMTGEDFARIPIPCRRDRYTARGGPDTDWPTPEPPHRINQTYMEPILQAYAAAQPGLTVFQRTELVALAQDGTGVTATLRDLDSGEVRSERAAYLVGCDGGKSTVRKQIGAQLEGTAIIQRVQSTYIDAPDLLDLLPGKRAWVYHSLNPDRCGTVFAIDGKRTWLIHNVLRREETDFEAVNRDASIRHILGVDKDFSYDIVSNEDWIGRRLVADRFRTGRAFIAGDAAHLWVPYAGYGLNAGIADAVNLAWLLAARLQGWAGEGILDAYDAERRPITDQVSHYVMDHAMEMMKARHNVPADIEAPDAKGAASRALIGKESYELNVQQYCCAGLNFGYFYQSSPIIDYDDEPPPAYAMGSFTPSTVPGCRAPHFWLANGRSLYDELGPGYTLLRIDARVDVAPLIAAAAKARMPFEVLDLAEQPDIPETYRHALLIVRSDQHVAWRGDRVPPVAELLARLRGELPAQHAAAPAVASGSDVRERTAVTL